MKTHIGPHGSEGMAGVHVRGYVKGQCGWHGLKTYNQRWIGYMYGLMTDERLDHVGISTHSAGKSDTKLPVPQ